MSSWCFVRDSGSRSSAKRRFFDAAVRLEGHATVLLVGDVSRSVDYYRDRLDFEVERWDVTPEH